MYQQAVKLTLEAILYPYLGKFVEKSRFRGTLTYTIFFAGLSLGFRQRSHRSGACNNSALGWLIWSHRATKTILHVNTRNPQLSVAPRKIAHDHKSRNSKSGDNLQIG
jgi:hypothetical protein